ncbi:MAG: tyrosine-type recombinase/integrase [Patescibacteria group bacterium]|nr:tyrosine-type recombinase/integrase [Patescibacteria group bacterium]
MQTKTRADSFERIIRKRLLDLETSGISPFRESETIFEVFVERWMRDYVAVRNRHATIRSKRVVLRQHLLPAFGPLPMRAITEERIDQLASALKAQGMSPKTINNIFSVLRTCLGSAVRWNLLASVPPIPMLKVPEHAYKYLSADEVQRLVAATKPGYWRTFIVFLAHTGCRFGEAAAIRWEDLELDGPAPRVRIQRGLSVGIVGPTKNGRMRDIPLTPDAAHALRTMPRSPGFVFALPSGGLPHCTSSVKHLHKVCDRAGMRRVSWHVLRHTFATELSARRVPLRTIQDLLGHSSIAMTCRYAHVADKSLREAVAELPGILANRQEVTASDSP